MRVWASRKNLENTGISCPLCRNTFPEDLQERMAVLDKDYVRDHHSHGIACQACGSDILIKLYKCLLCEKCYLCSTCYFKW
jgi:DNA-directed RNA polymerase subunit RPC12/RpoP